MNRETREQRYWREHHKNRQFNAEVAAVFGTVTTDPELRGIQCKLQRDH